MHEKGSRSSALGRRLGGVPVLALTIVLLAASAASMAPAKASERIAAGPAAKADDPVCTGAGWNNSHLIIGVSSCMAGLWGQYEENRSAIPNETNGYNFSFYVAWVGEFTPSGQLVRLASPLAPVSGAANATVRRDTLNLSVSEVIDVTNASGQWTPNDAWYGSSSPWNVSSTTVGTMVFGMGVHVNVSQFAATNSTANASSSVKFDVGVSGWPWASRNDQLGFVLDSLGAWGSHFVYNATTSTLAEKWNATNRTFISVVFGGTANVTYPSEPGAAAQVSEEVGIFPAGIPARQAVVLVAFGGVPGNYSKVAYDPWVVLSLLPSTSSIPPPPSSGGPAWWIVAAAVVVLVVGLVGIAGWVGRAQWLRREGEELLRGMRAEIGNPPGSPGRPR